MDKEIFDLGDYVITKEGYRGYIVDTLDSEDFKEKIYAIRLTSSYVFKQHEDLKKDSTA